MQHFYFLNFYQILMQRKVLACETGLTLLFLIHVPVRITSQKSERSCTCLLGTGHLTCKGERGGYVFLFCSEIFSQTIQELEFFFLSRIFFSRIQH